MDMVSMCHVTLLNAGTGGCYDHDHVVKCHVNEGVQVRSTRTEYHGVSGLFFTGTGAGSKTLHSGNNIAQVLSYSNC